MNTRAVKASVIAASLAALAVLLQVTVSAHHSFAMYDQKKVVTHTGVVKQFVPQANHAEIHFLLLADDHKSLAKGKDGKNVEWGIEMAGTAQLERQGISPKTFGAGHGVQRAHEPAARRIELRRPRRRAGQVPGGYDDQQAEAPGARQALRLGCRPHPHRRHELLTLRTFAAEFRVRVILSSAARSRAPTHVSILLCMPRHRVRSRPRSSACDSADRGGPVRRRYSAGHRDVERVRQHRCWYRRSLVVAARRPVRRGCRD